MSRKICPSFSLRSHIVNHMGGVNSQNDDDTKCPWLYPRSVWIYRTMASRVYTSITRIDAVDIRGFRHRYNEVYIRMCAETGGEGFGCPVNFLGISAISHTSYHLHAKELPVGKAGETGVERDDGKVRCDDKYGYRAWLSVPENCVPPHPVAVAALLQITEPPNRGPFSGPTNVCPRSK